MCKLAPSSLLHLKKHTSHFYIQLQNTLFAQPQLQETLLCFSRAPEPPHSHSPRCACKSQPAKTYLPCIPLQVSPPLPPSPSVCPAAVRPTGEGRLRPAAYSPGCPSPTDSDVNMKDPSRSAPVSSTEPFILQPPSSQSHSEPLCLQQQRGMHSQTGKFLG